MKCPSCGAERGDDPRPDCDEEKIRRCLAWNATSNLDPFGVLRAVISRYHSEPADLGGEFPSDVERDDVLEGCGRSGEMDATTTGGQMIDRTQPHPTWKQFDRMERYRTALFMLIPVLIAAIFISVLYGQLQRQLFEVAKGGADECFAGIHQLKVQVDSMVTQGR